MAKLEQCSCQVRFPVKEWESLKAKCHAANVSINQCLVALGRLLVKGDIVIQSVGVLADLNPDVLARPGAIMPVKQRKKVLRVRRTEFKPISSKPATKRGTKTATTV